MTVLASLFDISLLREMLEARMVACEKHNDGDLYVLNYTSSAQYTGTWNDVTRRCRGLIVDGHPLDNESSYVVARPFEKFFNLSEHENVDGPHILLPTDRSFHVSAKMDGSLGILYNGPNGPAIATRGSFVSEQADWSTAFLRQKMDGRRVPDGVTLLFEIIYPENRIIVDYGDHKGLTLLAAIDNKTGADVNVPSEWADWLPRVQSYDGGIGDIADIVKLIESTPDDWKNHEGFVLRFAPINPCQPSLRVKAKFSEYVRLHRIVTGVSTKTIWEYLSMGRNFDELLNHVPDEFYDWVRATADHLRSQFAQIESEARAIMLDKRVNRENRKETALFFRTQPNHAVLFKMLDNANFAPAIWRTIKPLHAKHFRQDD